MTLKSGIIVCDLDWLTTKMVERLTATCTCGTIFTPQKANLAYGLTKSCGCKRGGASHRMSYSPEYKIWNSMVDRCKNPNNDRYSSYGGRGISVQDSWKTFEGFFADMGLRPSSDLELDRINNDGNYCKENCRWTTRTVQLANRRPYKNSKGYNVSMHGPKFRLRVGIGAKIRHVGVFETLDQVKTKLFELEIPNTL